MFTDIETLAISICFYPRYGSGIECKKIEEIRMQADLFYLHARYDMIDMITNAGVVHCHGTCLSDLPCQILHAMTNEIRHLYSDIVTDQIWRL